MRIFGTILLLSLLMPGMAGRAMGQSIETEEVITPIDTLINPPEHLTVPTDTARFKLNEQNRALYDSLGTKKRRGLGKLVYDMLFIDPNKRPKRNTQVIDEAELLQKYDGKRIASIHYDRHDVFEDKSNWFRSLANGMHVRTMESTVERDMLFKPGDIFNAETAVASNQLLQSRPYISDSWIKVTVDPSDTTCVEITVTTLDNWTIGVDGERRSNHRLMFYLYDVNFFGTGNRVGLKTYFQYKKWDYGGNIVDFENPNFLGTRYTAKFKAGRDFESSRIETSLDKKFILPTDYEVGISFSNVKDAAFPILCPDSILRYKVRPHKFDIWGGKSWLLPSVRSSIYVTGHYGYNKYALRPEDTDATNNPLFHSYNELLFGTGIYWERFYTSSMVYGFGFQEYIAAGHRIELVGGYSWQEFGKYWYAGFNSMKGGFIPVGFLMGKASFGTYINSRGGDLWRTVLNLEGRWISNLWGGSGKTKVRQFVTFRWTQGWNMGTGAGSLVRFTRDVRPVSFETYAAGRNRLLLNTESVVFTKFQPLGFRIAIFGFADAGLIGDSHNPFRNDFFGTFGIGIRFKNERLVFSAFQLRLGFAFGKHGFLKNQMFSGSAEQRIEQHRFIPSYPQRVDYE